MLTVRKVSRALFGLAVVAFAAHEAWLIAEDPEGTLADVRELLSGLAAVARGSASDVAALKRGPPDIARDRHVFSVFATVMFVLNWGIRLVLVQPFATACVQLRGPQVAKFSQSTMEAMVYGGFTALGLLVVPSQEFVWPSARWWSGWKEGGHEVMRADLKCYYILYVSRYYQALVSLMFEIKRKDFVEMVVHHVTTIVIICMSYVYGWNRIGVVVMAIFDPADVPLHLAKLCKYTAEATGRHVWQFCADRLFEVFAVTFFSTRLVLYSYVCWSGTFEATRYFPAGVAGNICIFLLWTLFLLQVFWFSLIVKVAIRLLAGTSVEDIRSDDEDEDQSKAQKKDN